MWWGWVQNPKTDPQGQCGFIRDSTAHSQLPVSSSFACWEVLLCVLGVIETAMLSPESFPLYLCYGCSLSCFPIHQDYFAFSWSSRKGSQGKGKAGELGERQRNDQNEYMGQAEGKFTVCPGETKTECSVVNTARKTVTLKYELEKHSWPINCELGTMAIQCQENNNYVLCFYIK